MSMLKKLRNRVIGITILAGMGVAFYYVVLTPEARQSLHEARLAVTDSYHRRDMYINRDIEKIYTLYQKHRSTWKKL